MKKKILVICNSSSGFYRLRKELIAEAIKLYDITILAPDTGYTDNMIKMGCSYKPIDYDGHGTNPIEETRLISRYKKEIKDFKPDIVLTYAIKPNTYAGIICQNQKIPYIVNITGLGTAVEYKSVLQIVTLALYRLSLRKAKMVFFQNNENLEFMKQHNTLGVNNYSLIPGSGVNLDQYRIKPYPKDSKIRLVFIARVIKEKGIDQFIAAANYFADNPDVEFHVCGKCGGEYTSLMAELNERNILIYHGVVEGLDNIAKIYEMASCIVHPSYYPEGLSNVLLEASASGRPIITTDRSGCREVVDDNVNGLLIRQKDSKDLIEKIKKFVSLPCDKRREMGLAGRAKVEHEFDRKIVINSYMTEIEKAVKGC